MALTGTSRGTGGNTTTSTTIAIVPTSNLTAGSLAVLCLAYDNSGTAGADPYVSINDNGGNVWTSRIASLNDPGAANAGSTLRIFTAYVWKLTTAETVTVTFNPTTVSKAWVIMEVTAAAGSTAEYSTGNQTTAATANPTVTSASIALNDMIVGAIGADSNAAMTADADTTNGSWSTNQNASAGNATSASNIEIMSQRKVVTLAGAQTYNITLTAANYSAAWVEILERAIPNPGSATRARVV